MFLSSKFTHYVFSCSIYFCKIFPVIFWAFLVQDLFWEAFYFLSPQYKEDLPCICFLNVTVTPSLRTPKKLLMCYSGNTSCLHKRLPWRISQARFSLTAIFYFTFTICSLPSLENVSILSSLYTTYVSTIADDKLLVDWLTSTKSNTALQ